VPLPTLSDLKRETNIPNTTSDDELVVKLDQAVAVVEGLIGPVGDPSPVTETHWNVSSDVLVLRRMPVAGLVSVSSRYGATTTALTLADFELDPATGIVRLVSGGRFVGTYTVTYTAGYVNLPADVSGAIVLIAAHLWETQRMSGQSSDTAPAGFGGLDGVPDAGSAGRGFLIPNRAQELLQPHMRPSIA
jgi:hypothetical protein